MFNIFRRKQVYGTGALKDPLDIRDFRYEPIAAAAVSVDWEKGFDKTKHYTKISDKQIQNRAKRSIVTPFEEILTNIITTTKVT